MADTVIFPSKKDSVFRSKLIDSLLDIRLTLSIKKVTSDFIKKNDFKKIVDDVKERLDLRVRNAIDDVFSEYFVNKDIKENNKSLSLDEMQTFNDSSDSIDSSNSIKGPSLVKTDSHYKSSNTSSSDKAA